MTDECEYDALTQNTLTATFSPEHVQIDTKDGEEDEEALDESMSPYLASTQSTSDASQCPRCMGSPVGSAQEEKLVAVQTPTSRPLCDTFKFEVTPNNVTCTSLLGAAKFHQAIASQTIASSPLRQEAGGTVGVDAEESRHASPLLPTVCPPSGVRSNDCTGKQLVPREDTAAISTPGSCSHITHGPASGTSGKLRGSEHSPPSLGRNRGVETRFRAARHVCLGKHGTDEGGAIGLAGGPGRSRGNYLLGPMGHSTSTKVPKPIKDIVAESLKAMLERDDRERLKRVRAHDGMYYCCNAIIVDVESKCWRSSCHMSCFSRIQSAGLILDTVVFSFYGTENRELRLVHRVRPETLEFREIRRNRASLKCFGSQLDYIENT